MSFCVIVNQLDLGHDKPDPDPCLKTMRMQDSLTLPVASRGLIHANYCFVFLLRMQASLA